MKRIAFLVVVLLTVGYGFSAASQVEFVAKVKSIELEGENVATLTMQLTSTFDVKVGVTEKTQIRGEGDSELALTDLKADMLLKVEGIFTDAMILAKEIEVCEGVSDFEVKGKVDAIDTGAKTIKVLGLVITYNDETSLKGVESFADIKAGDKVKVEGKIEDTLIATSIIVDQEDEDETPETPRITFEGILTSVSETELKVLIEGVDEVVVKISDKTDIHGELAVGVGVLVSGTIGEDLAVDAAKVIVKKLLEVAPEKLKLQVDQVRQVVVILHTLFDEDVEVKIVSAKPEIAEVAVDKIVIPAGKQTGKFDVKGKAPGQTVIEVSLPESMGETKSQVQVAVEDKGGKPGDDDENGGSQKPALTWSPTSVSLQAGQTKQVTLRLLAEAQSNLTVALSLASGETGIVKFPDTVDIAKGTRYGFVNLEAQKAGRVVVLAKLPTSAGGGEAKLTVEVKEKGKK